VAVSLLLSFVEELPYVFWPAGDLDRFKMMKGSKITVTGEAKKAEGSQTLRLQDLGSPQAYASPCEMAESSLRRAFLAALVGGALCWTAQPPLAAQHAAASRGLTRPAAFLCLSVCQSKGGDIRLARAEMAEHRDGNTPSRAS